MNIYIYKTYLNVYLGRDLNPHFNWQRFLYNVKESNTEELFFDYRQGKQNFHHTRISEVIAEAHLAS